MSIPWDRARVPAQLSGRLIAYLVKRILDRNTYCGCLCRVRFLRYVFLHSAACNNTQSTRVGWNASNYPLYTLSKPIAKCADWHTWAIGDSLPVTARAEDDATTPKTPKCRPKPEIVLDRARSRMVLDRWARRASPQQEADAKCTGEYGNCAALECTPVRWLHREFGPKVDTKGVCSLFRTVHKPHNPLIVSFHVFVERYPSLVRTRQESSAMVLFDGRFRAVAGHLSIVCVYWAI